MLDTDRPWLRKDTIYAATPGGLLVSNATTGFEIVGKSAYALFHKVAPLLSGQMSVGEIRRAVPEHTWRVILNLVDPLVDRGFLRWIPEDDVASVDETVRGKYSNQIAFLAQFTSRPHGAFLAFNEAEIMLVGSDPVLESLASNLRENGAQQVTVTTALTSITAADLVILGPSGLDVLEDTRRVGVPVMVICPAAEHLWALPVPWDEDSVSWYSGHCSLKRGMYCREWSASFANAQRGTPNWDYATSSEAVQRLFGALLAYEVFKGLTGAIEPETRRALFALNCLTGETRTYPVTPIFEDISHTLHHQIQSGTEAGHPWDPGCLGTEDAYCDVASSRAQDYDHVWAPLASIATSPVREFIDTDLTQIPVKVSAVSSEWGEVFAASPWTTADARIEAISRTFALALSSHAVEDETMRVLIGVDRSPAGAVRSVLDLAMRSIRSTQGVPMKMSIPDPLGTFVVDVADGLSFEDLGQVAGMSVCVACHGAQRTIGVGSTVAEAQARAAIELIGLSQTGHDSASAADDSVDLAHAVRDDPQIRTLELVGGWHLAILASARP